MGLYVPRLLAVLAAACPLAARIRENQKISSLCLSLITAQVARARAHMRALILCLYLSACLSLSFSSLLFALLLSP